LCLAHCLSVHFQVELGKKYHDTFYNIIITVTNKNVHMQPALSQDELKRMVITVDHIFVEVIDCKLCRLDTKQLMTMFVQEWWLVWELAPRHSLLLSALV
jgi:hypothetical protein